MTDKGTKEFQPLKRGDLVVSQCVKRHYAVHTGVRQVLEVEVAEVVSVTREGIAKAIITLGRHGRRTPRDWDILLKIPALSEMERFKAACAHRQSLGADTWQPFDSINDVRELARKFK